MLYIESCRRRYRCFDDDYADAATAAAAMPDDVLARLRHALRYAPLRLSRHCFLRHTPPCHATLLSRFHALR